MTLIKHEFPILERDTEQLAVIMPNRKNLFTLPPKCVFAFLGNTTDQFAISDNSVKIGAFDSITKLFPIYKTIYKNEEIAFCQAPCGASPATQILDYLISYGAKYIIACGSCGVLKEIDENEMLIPTVALRDEGTSYQYIAPSREININNQAITAIKKAAEIFNIKYEECKTWTTDGFYRETKDMVNYRKQEGCTVVEMECSALTACASFRNVIFGQLLFSADTLACPDQHDERSWGISSFETAFQLSLEAVYQIDK